MLYLLAVFVLIFIFKEWHAMLLFTIPRGSATTFSNKTHNTAIINLLKLNGIISLSS